MKKIIGVIACGLFLNAAAASSQVTDKEKVQMEKRIEKLIKKMTLEEKVGLLHGNSKFYVAGVERLGIPEWSLSDDASLGVLRIGLRGLLAEVHTFDDGALLRNLDLQDFARLAFAVTGDNLNLIPFLNM